MSLQFACNGEICSPGRYATFGTYGDLVSWANRVFKLGWSRSERRSAYIEVIPHGGRGVEGRCRVDRDDAFSSQFQYYVFSVCGTPSSPAALKLIAVGGINVEY